MKLSTGPYKGARDFYPKDKRIQKYMFAVMRKVVESYGYEEYDAPILEPIELYLSKSSAEIVTQQTYTFEDRGGRKVTIRPEMTPTVSRMVAARRQELSYPLRWYSIPNVWRYERPQHGRLREHWQLNVDIFGVQNIAAEVEVLQIANGILKAFGATEDMYEIRINSRVALGDAIKLAVPLTSVVEVIRIVDMFEKMSRDEFIAAISKHLKYPDKLLNYLHSAIPTDEISKIISACSLLGIKVEYVPSIARGFDYYTDIVFEVFDRHKDNNRSMFGGGRYDNLIGQFNVEPLPTVGFGMGDVTLQYFLELHNLLPQLDSATDAVVILASSETLAAQKVIKRLRANGLNLSVDITERKMDKQIKAADKSGIRFVIIIGDRELSDGRYVLKDLSTGKSNMLTIEEITSMFKKNKEAKN